MLSDNPEQMQVVFKTLNHGHKSLLIDLYQAHFSGDKVVWGYHTQSARPSYRTRSSGRTHSVHLAEELIDLGLVHQRPQERADFELVITKEGRNFCTLFAIGVVKRE